MMTKPVGAMVCLLKSEGLAFKEEGILSRLEKAPFPYPIAEIVHIIFLITF